LFMNLREKREETWESRRREERTRFRRRFGGEGEIESVHGKEKRGIWKWVGEEKTERRSSCAGGRRWKLNTTLGVPGETRRYHNNGSPRMQLPTQGNTKLQENSGGTDLKAGGKFGK